jgi:multiple sugar transport system ATP-binding protein
MDEPLSNLDAKLRTEMRTELKRLHVDTDSTFVYVTHDQLEAMTLSTKVCLMEKGLLQQYAAPLEMYLRPANLFVADFMGSPTMNFLKGTAKKTGDNTCEVSFCGITRTFTSAKPLGELPEQVTLGVRPEFITITPDSDVKASVYSTLPSGMETTVKLRLGGEIVTSVIFGSVDFPIDTEVSLDFHGTDMLLYSTETGKLLADGSL